MPTGQAVQVGEPAGAKVPAAQAVQAVDPGADVLPAAHEVHAAAPATVEKVPAAQLAHVLPAEYWPATQLEQLTPGPPVSAHVLVAAASTHACVVPEEPGEQYQV